MSQAKTLTFFRGSSGLNTKNHPGRIVKNEIADLAYAVNVDVSSSGRINRRKGYAATGITSPCHSLFSHKDRLYGAFSDGLGLINEGMTGYSLLDALVRNRVSYTVANDSVYYTDGFSNGVIKDGVRSNWPSFTEPAEASREDLFSPFPAGGSLLAYHLGRMAVGYEDSVFLSEPMNFSAFNLYKWFFAFPGTVTSLFSCDGGSAALYVGTTAGLYALAGRVREESRLVKIRPEYAPVSGTVVCVRASMISPDFPGALSLPMWLSEGGICYGDDSGVVRCLTEDKIDIPSGLSVGCSVVFDDFFRTYCH
jgi:hypothetical protein